MSDQKKLLCPLTFSAVISAGVRAPKQDDFRCHGAACALFDQAWDKCGLLSQAAMVTGVATTLADLVNVLQMELQNIINLLAAKK